MDIWLSEFEEITINTFNILKSIDLGQNPCIIFNIDDTLIHEDGKILSCIINIYNYALQLGIKIFIITNRTGLTEEIVGNTLLDLKNKNLNYEAIYFKKHENRNNIINKGYNIILCIGSNDSDIYDEFTGIPIKIPIYIKNNLKK